MKWQIIANVTGQIKDEAKSYLVHKLQKDASVELPALWTDFMNETTQSLHDSQSNIEVLPNSKTGGLSTILKFDELHPDFSYNDKLFVDYALEKYDQRAAGYLSNVKNPFTRKQLQSRLGEYRVHFADNINHTDIKLIEGKRHMMAIEGVEKYKKLTYDNPQNYENNLNDCINAFNALPLLPLDKERRINEAKLELAGAASQGMLKSSPDSLINMSRLAGESQPLWMQHLSLEQRIKLDNSIKHREEHRQIMRQHEVGSAIKSNYASIQATGEPVKGIDDLIIAAYGRDSRQYQQFKQDENLYKQAFSVTDKLKHVSFEEGKRLLEALKSPPGDPDFFNKQNILKIAQKFYEEQLRQAATDPARLVDELYIDEIPENLNFAQRIIWRTTKQQQKGILTPRRLTNFEQAEFIKKINSNDINEVKSTIDSVISLRDDNTNYYGLEVMEEILGDQSGRLPSLIKAYATRKLFNNEDADIFLEMIGRNNLFSKSEETEFNNIIEKDKDVMKWTSNLRKQNIQNTPETDEMKGAIKYLAAYYHVNLNLSPDKAVKKAVDRMINEQYMEVAGLPLQKQIIVNNKIENLEEDYIEAGLSELRMGIINGSINYGYNQTFGRDAEYAKDMIREKLYNGRWHLTPDKKRVYFGVLTEDGRYLPLLNQEGKILEFNLNDLNNPDALEMQKQRFEEAAREIFFYNGMN